MGVAARYVTELVGAFERYADKPAIGVEASVLTFSQALDEVYRLAGALAQAGVGRGSGLACVVAGNRPEVVLVRLAAHVLGARLTQVVGSCVVGDLEFVLRDCRPDLVLHDVPVPDTGVRRLGVAELIALAAAQNPVPVPVRAREGDVARVTYTSGTTGRPKGVASTFAALAARWAVRPEEAGSVFLSVTSLADRAGGRCLEHLRAGGRVELLEPFDPVEFAIACRRLAPVSTYLMPSMVYRLLDHPGTVDGVPGLHAVSYGASPIQPERL